MTGVLWLWVDGQEKREGEKCRYGTFFSMNITDC